MQDISLAIWLQKIEHVEEDEVKMIPSDQEHTVAGYSSLLIISLKTAALQQFHKRANEMACQEMHHRKTRK